MVMMTRKRIHKPTPSFAAKTLLSIIGRGKTILSLKRDQLLFSQGGPSDAVFYVLEGKVKLVVASPRGREAVVAVLGAAAFVGEACLSGQRVRTSTATSMGESTIVRIEKDTMIRVLHEEPVFSELFMSYLLSRNIRIEEDLLDQLFNSSEKRLARVLLLLAHFGKESKTEVIIPTISQQTLADMIGITRSKVSFFMNRFRKLGFVDNHGGLRVHSSLLDLVLHD